MVPPWLPTVASAHEGEGACPDTQCPNALKSHPDHKAAHADRFTGTLPPLPPDVSELKFREFFALPMGSRGPELTAAIQKLDGQRVRILGYMVRSSFSVPGTLLLTPFPVSMDDCHYGLADDLPPQTVHVEIPEFAGKKVPFTPGLLLLTGALRLGPEQLPDGRNFTVHLRLERPPATAPVTRGVQPTLEPAANRPHPVGDGTAENAENAEQTRIAATPRSQP